MAQSLLMCPPDHFGVIYQINPWMENQVDKVDTLIAKQQWNDFHTTLCRLADVQLIRPQPDVPDMVFTANAGVLRGRKFIPSRFRHQERRPEEPFFKRWFQSHGYEIIELADTICFEGAGDALFQPGANLLWAGYGFRSDLEAYPFLEKCLDVRVISLRLVNPSFYHLDTCFCPLLNNQVMYYPEAFDASSRELIEQNTQAENRIILSREDALSFACNAVLVEKTIILNSASSELTRQLESLGYAVCVQPMTEFLKAGGANKCLTLALDWLPAKRNRISGNPLNRPREGGPVISKPQNPC